MKWARRQSGQTSVEYILLVAVMLFISIAFFKQIRQYIITNPDSMINRYLTSFESQFGGGNRRFKFYSLGR